MNPTDNVNSQPGGDAQATIQQVAGKTLSFFRKNLVMTSIFSTLFAVFIIVAIIIFFFGDVGGVAGGQPNPTLSPTPTPTSTSTPTPSPSPANGDIVYWAQQITDALTLFPQLCHNLVDMYDVMETTITNGTYTALKRPGTVCGFGSPTYFCTDLVIDAYNLAGLTSINRSIPYIRGVPYMIRAWRAVGWTVLTQNNEASLQQLQPGDVIFFMLNGGGEHVVIIQSISLTCDQQHGCYGRIYFLQANGIITTDYFNIANGVLVNKYNNGWTFEFGLAGR